jgi:hypothetical protein
MPRDATPSVSRPRYGDGRGRPVYDSRTGRRRPAWRSYDHRFARPSWRTVRVYSTRSYVPRSVWYRPLYTRWWVHPYYRWTYATVACTSFDFYVDPWTASWRPPTRNGWRWQAGFWTRSGYWVPGYWEPVSTAPVWARSGRSVSYVYVPGWWNGSVYVDGYWRAGSRSDGDWDWIDGRYVDGVYRWGHWRPRGAAPDGYVWEAGYWDGETWVGGFWRPEFRRGYRWVSPWYDEAGVFNSGYWEPTEDRIGYVWIPGWFDGQEWIPGYWVSEQEYQAADPDAWDAPDGWDSGWDDYERAVSDPLELSDDAPLAMPVQ